MEYRLQKEYVAIEVNEEDKPANSDKSLPESFSCKGAVNGLELQDVKLVMLNHSEGVYDHPIPPIPSPTVKVWYTI